MKTKRLLALLAAAAMMTSLAACGGKGSNDTNGSAAASGGSDLGLISVVSREDGSGTRGAFIELVGDEEKDADGNKTDMTTEDATITNNTEVMLSTVAGDPAAIGYVSLGSLNDNVKALKIDGAAPSADTVKDGSYKIARPFNIATKGEATGLAKDFINFILSADGQKIVAGDYITIDDNAPAFQTDGSSGKLVVGGSSSVTPLMEKLIEAYKGINSAADIELQASDSTSGMTGTIDGTYDIGMASRELKDEEKTELTNTVIAMDGIAVIVNNDNPIEEMTSEQVGQIYKGEITDWSELSK